MSEDKAKLEAMSDADLRAIAKVSGVSLENTSKDGVITAIVEEIDEINTWLEAKAGVPADMKERSDEAQGKKKTFKGYCVKTGEKLYS